MDSAKIILKDELPIFEQHYKSVLKSKTPLLSILLRYLIRQKGKQIRPMFVLLTAKLNGQISENAYRAATLVELLHTATLVHDDVVDRASTRRGFFSINHLWKSKGAVLVGDYLLAKGLILATENNDFEMLRLLSGAVKRMSEGELLQLEKSRKLNLDEKTYFEIIGNKTASLLSSACAVGAHSVGAPKNMINQMADFGENAGIAFQIKDDLLDYGNAELGKPTGNDIREKKLTLPLIYSLQQAEKTTVKRVKYILKNKHKNQKEVSFVMDVVKSYGGIAYAEKKMNEYRDEALKILSQFPPSDIRNALEDLVRYITDRTY